MNLARLAALDLHDSYLIVFVQVVEHFLANQRSHQSKNRHLLTPRYPNPSCRSCLRLPTAQALPRRHFRRYGCALGHNQCAKLRALYLQSTRKVHEFCRLRHHRFCLRLPKNICWLLPKTLRFQSCALQETALQVCPCAQVRLPMHTPKSRRYPDESPNASLNAPLCRFRAGQSPRVCRPLFVLLPKAATNVCRWLRGLHPRQQQVLYLRHQACRCSTFHQTSDPMQPRMSRHKSCAKFLAPQVAQINVASNNLLQVLVTTSYRYMAVPNQCRDYPRLT